MVKKKIIFIDFGPGFGGSVVNLVNIVSRGEQLSIDPVVIVDHNDPESLEYFEEHNIAVIYFKRKIQQGLFQKKIDGCRNRFLKKIIILFTLFLHVMGNILFYFSIVRFGKKINPDIVQFNNLISIDELIIAKFLKRPTICHVQRGFYQSKFTRFLLNEIDQFVAISKYVKNALLEAGVDESKILLIYNAVDLFSIELKALEKNENFKEGDDFQGMRVGLFGCLLPWKGQEVFINSVNLLMMGKHVPNVRFYLIGNEPQGDVYVQELRSLVEDFKLEKHIKFLGYAKNVYSLMKDMDVVVHASVEPEPFGLVLIEAMALGKPVVATRQGGPVEIIENEKNGLLVTPGVAQELSQAILTFISDRNLMLQLGNQARQTVSEKFNIELFLNSFKNLYEEIDTDRNSL